MEQSKEREQIIVKDATGTQSYVTWCDGERMRITPVDGNPMASHDIPFDESITVLSGAAELDRMISILGRNTVEGKVVARAYTKEQSSNVAEIRYDDEISALDVTFHNGGRYRYKDVPQAVFDDAVSAESIGKFVNQKVRGAFECEQLAAT